MDSKADHKHVAQEADQSMAPTVHSLKMFFQNQKQPIIGVKHVSDNHLETTSSASSVQSNQSKAPPIESSADKSYNRNNRVIPRPPQPIQSSDINVSPFHKPLNTSPIGGPVPPVPKPRKSLIKHQSSDRLSAANASQGSSDVHLIPNSLIVSLTKEINELNLKDDKSRAHSLQCLPTNESLDSTPENSLCGTTDEIIGSVIPKTDPNATKAPTKPRNRNTFKVLLKKSKLLSLRKRSAQKSDTKCQTNSDSTVSYAKPVKPTRLPPKPPILQFRPPAPLPSSESRDDFYEDTLPECPAVGSGLHGMPTGYELYNDSVDFEQIYSTLDNEDLSDDQLYEGVDHYDDGLTGDKDIYFADNYYEDNDSDIDRIYEVLPFEKDMETDGESITSNTSTIDLDEYLNDELNKQTISEVNAEEQSKSDQKMDSSERKRNLKAMKLKKKFNLNGDEIPVNAGIVKEDSKGNRLDLYVRKGETVLILRMEANPPGKWLAKNERSRIGFVNLDNISFDAESVKSIIKTLTASPNV